MQAHLLSFTAAEGWNGPAGLAHDAGNLLHALGLYCDLLEKPDVLREEHRHYAEELRGIAQRSAELVGRLAEVPRRAYPGRGNGFSELKNFEAILRQICGPRCAFRLELGASLPEGLVRPDVVERLLLNLVANAAEAIGYARASGGEVRAALRTEGGGLVLSVEDNGPGVELETALKFARPEEWAVRGERGLGHRILRELARESGAAFEMRVRPGSGSCFLFRWKGEVLHAC